MKEIFYRQSCVSCGQAVEFPPHNVGYQIQCPGCSQDMVLARASTWRATSIVLGCGIVAVFVWAFAIWPATAEIPVAVFAARLQPLVAQRSEARIAREAAQQEQAAVEAREQAKRAALREAELAAQEEARKDMIRKEAALKVEIQRQNYLLALEQQTIQVRRERERQAQLERERIAFAEANRVAVEADRIRQIEDYNVRVNEYNRQLEFVNQANYNAAFLNEMQRANAIREQRFLHPGYKSVNFGNYNVIFPSNVPVFRR